MKKIRSIFSKKEVILIFILVVLFLVIGYINNVFFSMDNSKKICFE